MSGSKSSSPDAAPADPLSLTVYDLRESEAAEQQRRTVAGRVKMLLVLAMCAAPVIASYLAYFVVKPSGRTNYGELVQPTRSMPALDLRTLDGQPVTARSLRGQWLLVAVGPGGCDAACEQRLYTQRQLREMLGRERDRVDKIWLVTDEQPLRPALAQAVSAPPALTPLRAPREQVAAWLQAAPGQALEDHLYVVDPMGEWMMRTPVDADPSRLKRDIDRLLRAAASWDKAGR